jgi:hypothetical protein
VCGEDVFAEVLDGAALAAFEVEARADQDWEQASSIVLTE